MTKRWALGVSFVLAIAGTAAADTGGSMGGGSWGGGGGGGGGYSSSGGGGYSSSGGWSSSGSSGSGSGFGFVFGLLFLGVVGVVKLMTAGEGRDLNYSDTFSTSDATFNEIDVSVLRIALDGRARKFVQNELTRIAGIADTKTDEGRTKMLREVALLLRRLRDAWVYGGAINEPMRSIAGAKSVFDRHVDDARARFREETVRNEQGQITKTPASAYTPRSDEGAGVILVSLVIAARRELFTVSKIGDGDDLRQALDMASHLTPGNLVAIEIVWQPSEETDRMSSMELEAKYPRPDLIPIRNALVGKTFCDYCGGPFPAELVSCPHCGAPAPGPPPAPAKAA